LLGLCLIHFFPQIGVGAVFISALAQSRLEVPHNPPSSQQDVLAIALQPIVAFVVLGSIVTRMSPRFTFEVVCSYSHLLDGLSIPFFSVGRRTLTFSRSLVGDQPDWLNWVRRVPPQEDAERITTASVNETEREGQNHVEWPPLSDLSELIPDGARSPRKLKFEEVCIALFPWPHLTSLIHSA
jgi:hypothetical protein